MAWLAFFDSMIAVALAMAGIAAAHYSLTKPFIGFQLFAGGLLFALLALVFTLIALGMMAFSPARRTAMPRAITGGILSLAILVPVVLVIVTHPYPAINDITTDTKNPPEFIHAQELPANQGRDLKYNAAAYAPVQEAASAYKDLAPLKLDGSPDDVFKKTEIIVGEAPVWQITYTDPQRRQLEGVATSWLFRFQDDFVIQVRPADGGGSLLEMRSKSRDGKGDFGANYNRIQSFFRLVQGQPRGVVAP
ncbi:MAG TPA: DUF1499 domain-containing protein [Candidatus Binataceae bacterium]|nr:DUF1499 domain-containing protein [Candidatus Binataceae bacterium]